MKNIRVANLNIKTENIDNGFFDKRLQKYETEDFTRTDMTLKTIAFEKIERPKGIIIDQIEDATIVQVGENRFCRYLSSRKIDKIFTAVYYNDTFSEVEIHLLKSIKKSNLTLTEFEYMYTGFAFTDRLTELGGAVLHGSALAYDNQGIVFSANSGTGKSTHTNLWREYFGSKVTMVNDDKPAIQIHEGIPFIYGTPWSGKTDLNENVQVPLKAIVFIKRSETNRIERLNIRDSIFSLTGQISRPYYDEKIGFKTLNIIDELVQKVPVYRLHCNISREAVKVVYNQLEKEGGIKL